ncbi:MAG TPA: lipoyl synthase [bacterium]|nr:lipoyl synthase [bacterium]HPG46373.1 lipoyl synthase [bacterium]HPM98713.1 lipoyl synthase [bacterium]
MAVERQPRPAWLKIKLPAGRNFCQVRDLVRDQQLHTVCESARCPNLGECWGRKTAAFMILGDICTRNCRFCAVHQARPNAIDPQEPERLAETVRDLGLRYVVITSVTRDDLPDGGANHFAETIRQLRRLPRKCRIEVLIPDFQGDARALQTVLDAEPDVLNHNIETVSRLYPQVRPMADYRRSLLLLSRAGQNGAVVKSGLMLGLGEETHEVMQTLQELRDHGVQLLTLGQYLQPSRNHLPVARYVTPEEFAEFKSRGLEMGFSGIESGPLVRSSYHADQQFVDVIA